MLWLYEIRVLFALFMVKVSAILARNAEKSFDIAYSAAQKASELPVPLHPHSLESLRRAQKVMTAVEAQDRAEDKWQKAEAKLLKRKLKHTELNQWQGRQVPGTLAMIQAWVAAGFLTYYKPEWVDHILTMFTRGG